VEALLQIHLCFFHIVYIATCLSAISSHKGGSRGGRSPPLKLNESNFFHHNLVQFGKQYSRYKAILSSMVLSQNCCEVYLGSLTAANPLWDLVTKYYWNRLLKLTGWIRPWQSPSRCTTCQDVCVQHSHAAKRLLATVVTWTEPLKICCRVIVTQ